MTTVLYVLYFYTVQGFISHYNLENCLSEGFSFLTALILQKHLLNNSTVSCHSTKSYRNLLKKQLNTPARDIGVTNKVQTSLFLRV